MKKTVGILYGGKSSEHEVSLRTACSILQALNYETYEVIPFYVDLTGKWNEGTLVTSAPSTVEELRFSTSTSVDLFSLKKRVTLFFPVIHGPFGEDGTLQGLLEMLDIPYVGCGVLASSAGMDKVVMKNIFKAEGLPQCRYTYVTRREVEQNIENVVSSIEQTLGYPNFIKPANLGSSVGINKASTKEELIFALQEASKFDRRIIIEEFVDGREIEIGVLGNDHLQTSVVGEIRSAGEFYDYTSKYKNGSTELDIPARIPESVANEVSTLAKRAFKALDGSGLSRIDFFWNAQTNQLFLNEINTMPGFTSFSMYPMLFKEAGIGYDLLIEELFSLAIQRYQDKKKNMTSAESFDSSKVEA